MVNGQFPENPISVSSPEGKYIKGEENQYPNHPTHYTKNFPDVSATVGIDEHQVLAYRNAVGKAFFIGKDYYASLYGSNVELHALGQPDLTGQWGCGQTSLIYACSLLSQIVPDKLRTLPIINTLANYITNGNPNDLIIMLQSNPQQALNLLLNTAFYPSVEVFTAELRNSIPIITEQILRQKLKEGPVIAHLRSYCEFGHTVVILQVREFINSRGVIEKYALVMDPFANYKKTNGQFTWVTLDFIMSQWHNGHSFF